MTTKPKARKFRIKRAPLTDGMEGDAPTPNPQAAAPQAAPRTPPPAAQARAAQAPAQPRAPQFQQARPQQAQPRQAQPQQRPATPSQAAPPPRSGAIDSAAQVAAELDIDAIRAEGLTGRQLRLARRVAAKNGLSPTSDFDAVRLLRARGIDPFQRSTMLELLVPKGDTAPGAQPPAGATPKTAAQTAGLPAQADGPARMQLPQTVAVEKQQLPSTEMASPAERRAAEIRQIQIDLAKRRRKKMALLLTRLAFFVGLPTLLAGFYFYAVATPMYSTKSEFLILKAESGGGAMGSMFSGTQFATNQDAIAVQSYLMSKDAMLRLDQDVGFKSHYTQDFIDPIQRLTDDPSNEEAYALYKRNIEIGYDPTEGVIRMEIMAADPDTAAEFSSALLGYAEERVDNLSLRKRSNAVEDAEIGLAEAEAARREAQERLVRLQQEGSIVDPEGRITALRGQISQYEVQLQEKQLQLQALLDNSRPNRSRVEGVQGDIRRLEALLAELNAQMTSVTSDGNSLAETAVQIQLSQADLATRDLMLQTALERLEQARRDADSQARYLTTSVEPVPSQDPSYPRKFENTILAFLIFGGIYLMVSLTASILREQVST